MKILRSFLIPLFTAGILLTSGLAQAIECEDGEGLFINLTSDDTWRAGMALNFANRNLDMDIPVTIFLNVEGVRVAVRRIPHHTNGLTDQTPQETLEEAMDNGARVLVCPNCLKQAGFPRRRLIDGVELGSPDITIPALHCSDKVISY